MSRQQQSSPKHSRHRHDEQQQQSPSSSFVPKSCKTVGIFLAGFIIGMSGIYQQLSQMANYLYIMEQKMHRHDDYQFSAPKQQSSVIPSEIKTTAVLQTTATTQEQNVITTSIISTSNARIINNANDAQQKEENHQRIMPEVTMTTMKPIATTMTPTTENPIKQTSIINRETHAIFYNVYLGPNREGDSTFARSIVKEHLEQISRTAMNRTLYYNVIMGKQSSTFDMTTVNSTSASIQSFISNLYPNSNLIQVYYKEAHEDVTLHALYRYCLEHPLHLVTYLHNKGSYSPDLSNVMFRRIATRAVLSDECARLQNVREYALLDSSTNDIIQCNVCGARINERPNPHVTGNMFTAACHYVRKLYPPRTYQRRRKELCRNYSFPIPGEGNTNCPFLNETTTTTSSSSSTRNEAIEFILNSHSRQYGFGRFALERWILSHPHLEPCHVFTTNTFSRCHDGCGDWTAKLQDARWNKRNFHQADWYRLRHRLLEFETLYPDRHAGKPHVIRQGFCRRFFSHVAPNPCFRPLRRNKNRIALRPRGNYTFPKWDRQ